MTDQTIPPPTNGNPPQTPEPTEVDPYDALLMGWRGVLRLQDELTQQIAFVDRAMAVVLKKKAEEGALDRLTQMISEGKVKEKIQRSKSKKKKTKKR